MELLQKEKELKLNIKKGKKYKEEYEEFLKKKDEKIKKIYSKKSYINIQSKKTDKKLEKSEGLNTDIDNKRL